MKFKLFVRTAGFDDSFSSETGYMVGCVCSGVYPEAFMIRTFEVDGMDATSTIVSMMVESPYLEQVKGIFLKGITVGGFNVIDIQELYEKLNIPVMVLMRKQPDMDEVIKALKNLDNWKERLNIIKKAGKIHAIEKGLFAQFTGIDKQDALELISLSRNRGNIPESLRLAHLVATAIVHGTSKKRV
jgi:hypothetical protein